MRRQYFVYVLTDLLGRVSRHRAGVGGKFTAKYACSKLVFYEVYLDPYNAIARVASSAELALSGVEGPRRNDLAFAYRAIIRTRSSRQ